MKRTLGMLVLVLGLAAGCGEGEATDPAIPDARTSASTRESDYSVVALLSETAAGGRLSTTLTPIDDQAALNAFTRQLSNESLVIEVERAVNGHSPSEGYELGAAVVAIGCDIPPGVTITRGDAGIEIVVEKVLEPLSECLAPVTTVAVVEFAA